MRNGHGTPSTVYVATDNELVSLVSRAITKGRPIMTEEMVKRDYMTKCMNLLRDGWYYFVNGSILVIAKDDNSKSMKFYCVNTTQIDIECMRDIPGMKLYGDSQVYALKCIVDLVRTEVLNMSFSVDSLTERIKALGSITDNVIYLKEYCGYYMFASHLNHNDEKSACLVLVSRRDGLYCEYICIPDSIVVDVVKLAIGAKYSFGINLY